MENKITCTHCGCLINNDNDIRQCDDGNIYCRDCYRDLFSSCDCCGCEIKLDDYDHSIVGDCIYCTKCYEENFVTCECCGETISIDDSYYQDSNYYCPDCYHDIFTTCECCDEVIRSSNSFYDEDEGETLCEDCYTERYGSKGLSIREYSYKPVLKFHRLPNQKSFLPVGIELEFSFGDSHDRSEALERISNVLDMKEDKFFFKKDASLNIGFEMVSHPMSLAFWKTQRETLEKIFDIVSDNVMLNRLDDGYHIHISKKAMTDMHKKRFENFFDSCVEQITVFARREDNGYFSFGKRPTNGKIAKQKGRYNDFRYRTVNWQNAATVEIRCFKSTVNVLEFYACLELVHAIYQFTKTCSITDIVHKNDNNKVWTKFIDFVRKDKRYQNLYRFWILETSH